MIDAYTLRWTDIASNRSRTQPDRRGESLSRWPLTLATPNIHRRFTSPSLTYVGGKQVKQARSPPGDFVLFSH